MSGRVTAEAEARRALRCLYIAVESDIADDVAGKVKAWVLEERHASIDACISIVKSRKPYDQAMVREMEKLKE